MTLQQLFTQKPDIVINTDIDGFLCGIVLQQYFGCRIVGFSNSKSEVWLTEDAPSVYAPVYIDLYVARPDVYCIEQHIIARDKAHHQTIVGYGTKFNPNLERGRTFVGDHTGTYYQKYPFGTIHYLLTLMAREGIDVSLPDLNRELDIPGTAVRTCLGHILMRADDALYSTLGPYQANALDWWTYLSATAHRHPVIKQMTDFIKTCDKTKNKDYKDEIGSFFTKCLQCDGADGAFNTITEPNGSLQERVNTYYSAVCLAMGISTPPHLPQSLILHQGKFLRTQCSAEKKADTSLLARPDLYSYAYIYGPNKAGDNFSYTIGMN